MRSQSRPRAADSAGARILIDAPIVTTPKQVHEKPGALSG